MKCQILFSGKNKKNISKCRLLKILPRVLSVKQAYKEQMGSRSRVNSRFPKGSNSKFQGLFDTLSLSYDNNIRSNQITTIFFFFFFFFYAQFYGS